MYTSGYANRSPSLSSTSNTMARVSSEKASTGLISEVVYREDQPMMTQLLLLPLLQQLGQQSRWQLWLTPQQKLSREWVQSAGLPLTKVMQISQLSPLPYAGIDGSCITYGQLQRGDRLAGRGINRRRTC
ncbi:SulA-like leucine-rich domain-containing protein [Citrobacter amalonaticus]|nr:SulA-like leucine-rich domain-containing protein [Citrobacter amalonaticus]